MDLEKRPDWAKPNSLPLEVNVPEFVRKKSHTIRYKEAGEE